MNKYIISIDQSTAGSKVLLINKYGEIIYKNSKKHTQIYPKRDYVEHNPNEIYENIISLIKELLDTKPLVKENIISVSITNQRETIVVWDKETGNPICNAIVWQCRRSIEICEELKEQGLEEEIKNKTGLVLDPYFSGTKIKWILDNVEGAKEKLDNNTLAIGTIESYLIYKLTNGVEHVTDYTNASRTMLLNINTLKWDANLLSIFGVKENALPKLKNCDDIFGNTTFNGLLEKSVPIAGVIGDSQGALFGQRCFSEGDVKATFGTGCSVMMNTGKELKKSHNGLVSALAWKTKEGPTYALEGLIHSNGDTLNWVKDNLGLFKDFTEFEREIHSINSSEGVYLVPAFLGLGYPHWCKDSKASIVGLSRNSDKRHIMRAALESMAYQINDVIRAMSCESKVNIKELKGDGGATTNKYLMNFLSSILEKKVVVSSVEELSAMGAAYLGALATGFFKDINEIKSLNRGEKEFINSFEKEEKEALVEGWNKAVKSVINM